MKKVIELNVQNFDLGIETSTDKIEIPSFMAKERKSVSSYVEILNTKPKTKKRLNPKIKMALRKLTMFAADCIRVMIISCVIFVLGVAEQPETPFLSRLLVSILQGAFIYILLLLCE